MRYTAMMWMRRANMAALGGGADIMPDQTDEDWLDWMDKRHMSDWSDEEMARYRQLTGQDTDAMSDSDYESENNV